MFSETQPGSDCYEYYVLGPTNYTDHGHVSDVVLDSIRSSPNPGGIQDVAIVHVGESHLIDRTSKVLVSANNPYELEVRVGPMTNITATCIATGETFPIIGVVINSENAPSYILLYESMNGESGSGFWGSDSNLYILSADVPVSDRLRKDLNIPDKYKFVTSLSAAKISW